MRRLGILALVIVLLIGAAVLFYKAVFPTYSYRYRMTVEVTVDGVVHSSSSVIEVRLRKQPQVFVPVPPVIAMVRGEAVFVDLGQGRNVIALLASGPNGSNVNYPSYIVSQHFKLSMVDYWDLIKYSDLRGSWDLSNNEMPTFVTFADLNDPKSARVVAPSEFERVFGPGVQLKRVEIEMTDAPMTREIEAKLPWLPHPRYLSGKFACGPSEPNCLHGGHLTR